MTENWSRQKCSRKSVRANGPIQIKKMKGAFSLNNPLVGTARPPESDKSSCPSNFLPAILGPGMGAPILWAPGKIAFFLQENRHAHKIPRFKGGGGLLGFFLGGGKCRFYFYGREDFSD